MSSQSNYDKFDQEKTAIKPRNFDPKVMRTYDAAFEHSPAPKHNFHDLYYSNSSNVMRVHTNTPVNQSSLESSMRRLTDHKPIGGIPLIDQSEF